MRLSSVTCLAISILAFGVASSPLNLRASGDATPWLQQAQERSPISRYLETEPQGVLNVAQFVQKAYQAGLERKGGGPIFYADGRRVLDPQGRPLEEDTTAELLSYSDLVRPRHGLVVESAADMFPKSAYQVKLEETVLKRFGLPWENRVGKTWLTEDRVKAMLTQMAAQKPSSI